MVTAVDEPRDSKDRTVEKEEVIAGQGDAHTPDEGSERYGARHHDRARDGGDSEISFPSRCFP